MHFVSKFTAFIVTAVVAATGAFAGDQAVAAASSAAVGDSLAAIPGSLTPNIGADIGEFNSSNMTVEVVLAPSNEAQLDELLKKVYDSTGTSYQQWLGTGE